MRGSASNSAVMVLCPLEPRHPTLEPGRCQCLVLSGSTLLKWGGWTCKVTPHPLTRWHHQPPCLAPHGPPWAMGGGGAPSFKTVQLPQENRFCYKSCAVGTGSTRAFTWSKDGPIL